VEGERGVLGWANLSILVSMGKHYEICVSGKVIRTFNNLKVNAFINLALASSVHFACLLEIFKKIS